MWRWFSVGMVGVLSAGVLTVHGPDWFAVSYNAADSIAAVPPSNVESLPETPDAVNPDSATATDTRPVVRHVPLPESVKALYMSACVAGTPSFRDDLVQLVQETELNSIMIDIKDYSGTLAFAPEHEFWLPAWQQTNCGARDMREFIERLHALDIYVIGRITVFQDPFHAARHPEWAVRRSDGSVWSDHKGLHFIDVAAQEYWKRIVDLSADAYNLGFDELNYDYVRYPSDGNVQDIVFPHTEGSEWPGQKPANLEAFFVYLRQAVDDETRYDAWQHVNTGRATATPWISADLFGMTTSNHDDLSIGQVQERAVPYFDFIAPMVYPSHYPNGWHGYGNPNHYPYAVVNAAMSDGVRRLQATTSPVDAFTHERIGTSTPALYRKPSYEPSKFRTWIQDFDYGGDYGPEEVRAQIKGSYDAGVMSWMLWAPSNRYTQAAFLPAADTSSTTRSTTTIAR